MKIKTTGLLIIVILLTALMMTGCEAVSSDTSSDSNSGNNDSEDWLIPSSQVYMGSAKDQIESIDDPTFSPLEEIDFMKDEDIIIVVKFGDEIRGYPHKVMNYHEIANDEINGIPVAVTFCPLTGSAMGWSRAVTNFDTTTFGVSGLIYKNNLIAFDRATDSNWSQMLSQSVNGEMMERRPEEVYHRNFVEMTWATWKQVYPEEEVLNGIVRRRSFYDSYPYGEDYPDDHEVIVFPIENEDDRLPRKTKIRGINYNQESTVFELDKFSEHTSVINYEEEGTQYVIAGNSENGIMISFYRKVDDEVLEFEQTEAPLPAIMEDQHGTVWNIFGEAIDGPMEGKQLKEVLSYNAYWFAWADFFPDAKIYDSEY